VIYPLLPPGACVALNGAITDPAANSEKGALSFCALCQGAPPCRDYEKTGGDLFACLDDGQTTGQAPTKYELIINTKTTKGLGPHHPTNTSRARRRGDRIAALMSSIGTSRHFAAMRIFVAIGAQRTLANRPADLWVHGLETGCSGRSLIFLTHTHPTGRLSARRANQGHVCPSPFAKIFPFSFHPNHFYIRHRPVPQRGGSRSSRTRDRMRWTQGAPETRALFLRTEKSCGPDAPTLASSS
jgi:hypothetical protein